MNLKDIVEAIVYAGTAAASFLCGYFLCEEVIFSQYEVVDDVQESQKVEETEEVSDKKEPDIQPVVETVDSKEPINQYKKAFSDYAKLGRDPRKDDEKDIVDYKEPYLITEDDFNMGNRHFEKIFVDYYADGVFVDEQTDEPDPSVEKYLGINVVDAFGYGSDDPDIVHIRNERISADYCIVRKGQTYKEYIGAN